MVSNFCNPMDGNPPSEKEKSNFCVRKEEKKIGESFVEVERREENGSLIEH